MEQVTARERLVRWEDPARTAGALRELSGLEGMRLVRDGKLPPPPIAVLMNFRLAEVEPGRVVFEASPGEEHYNPIGVVHGGYAMTLFDSAMGCAIHTMLPQGVGYTTTDVQVRLIRSLTKDSGVVRCEGTVLHVGRATAVAEGKLYDGAGKLLGAATTGCAMLRG